MGAILAVAEAYVEGVGTQAIWKPPKSSEVMLAEIQAQGGHKYDSQVVGFLGYALSSS